MTPAWLDELAGDPAQRPGAVVQWVKYDEITYKITMTAHGARVWVMDIPDLDIDQAFEAEKGSDLFCEALECAVRVLWSAVTTRPVVPFGDAPTAKLEASWAMHGARQAAGLDTGGLLTCTAADARWRRDG